MASIQPKNHTTGNKQFTIRVAQPEDATALLDYIRRVADETEFFIIESDEFPEEEEEQKFIQDHLDQPGQLLILAEADGKVIGNLSFENGRYRRIAHRGELGISVYENWRGRGVGTALLGTFLDWAESSPVIEKVCLEVFASNEKAIRFYKKLGFIEQGIDNKEVKRGPNEYVDAVRMYRFVK